MKKKVKKKETVKKQVVKGKITVSTHYKDYSDEREELLDIQAFDGPIAYASAKYGLKLNLGNYETALCECGITLPCYVEELSAAYKKAWLLIEAELQNQVEKIRNVNLNPSE